MELTGLELVSSSAGKSSPKVVRWNCQKAMTRKGASSIDNVIARTKQGRCPATTRFIYPLRRLHRQRFLKPHKDRGSSDSLTAAQRRRLPGYRLRGAQVRPRLSPAISTPANFPVSGTTAMKRITISPHFSITWGKRQKGSASPQNFASVIDAGIPSGCQHLRPAIFQKTMRPPVVPALVRRAIARALWE